LGKPNPNYIKQIAEWENLDLKKAVFIGDRLDTDILMGQRAEMDTIFVLSGEEEVYRLITSYYLMI
jgi:arabinose operon protein AraL